MRRLIAGALVAALLGPVAAHAQSARPKAAAAAAAAPVDPRAQALVQRYLKAIDIESNMDLMFKSMQPMVLEQLKTTSPSLSVEQREAVFEAVRKVMREKMTPKVIERMTPIYASTFTMEELQALVAFYEGPLGHSIMLKTPSLAPKSAAVVQQLMPQFLAESVQEAIAKLCPNGKCDAATPKATAS